MDSLQPMSSTQHLARKKALISYLLSIIIFWVHTSTFDNYQGIPGWFEPISYILSGLCFPVGTPTFLIISGALFFRDYTPVSFRRKLKNRVHSLLLPYFCWNVLMLLFQIITSRFLSQYFIGRTSFVFSWENIIGGLFHWKYNGPMWYVFTLMLLALMAPIFDVLLRNRWTAFCSVAALEILNLFGMGIPENRYLAHSSVLLFLIGAIWGRFYWDSFSGDTGKKYFWPSLIGFCLGTAYQYAQFLGWNPPILIPPVINAILCSFCLWILGDTLCRWITVRKFMEHSFWVYAMHMNVSAIITKLLYMAMPKHWAFSIPNFVLTTVVTLILIEAACQILKHWLPPLYRLLSGAR